MTNYYEQLKEAIPEVEELSEETRDYLQQGYTPTFKKQQDLFMLRKTVEGERDTHYIPREENASMEQVKETIKNIRERERAEKKTKDEDVKYIENLIKTPKMKSKPIEAKQIENAQFFQNIIYDLGKSAYFKLVGSIDWAEDEMNNNEASLKKFTDRLDNLIEIGEDVEYIEHLKLEIKKLDIKLFALAEQTKRLFTKYDHLKLAVMFAIAAGGDDTRKFILRGFISQSLVFNKDDAKEMAKEVVGVDKEVLNLLVGT